MIDNHSFELYQLTTRMDFERLITSSTIDRNFIRTEEGRRNLFVISMIGIYITLLVITLVLSIGMDCDLTLPGTILGSEPCVIRIISIILLIFLFLGGSGTVIYCLYSINRRNRAARSLPILLDDGDWVNTDDTDEIVVDSNDL